MLRARIIPCVDVRHGRTVKGVNFGQLVDSGDPVELSLKYAHDGADEVVWLDIVATLEERRAQHEQIGQLRRDLNIPLTVGGGIREIGDVEVLLEEGADKVSINSAALSHPDLIEEVAKRWGSQCVVVAIDAMRVGGEYRVFSHGGRYDARRELGSWLHEAQERGAGEFLLTSIDQDGRQQGYDLAMLDYARQHCQRPLIASGGAGKVEHLAIAMAHGHTSLLVASMLHQGIITVRSLKSTLKTMGGWVRE